MNAIHFYFICTLYLLILSILQNYYILRFYFFKWEVDQKPESGEMAHPKIYDYCRLMASIFHLGIANIINSQNGTDFF